MGNLLNWLIQNNIRRQRVDNVCFSCGYHPDSNNVCFLLKTCACMFRLLDNKTNLSAMKALNSKGFLKVAVIVWHLTSLLSKTLETSLAFSVLKQSCLISFYRQNRMTRIYFKEQHTQEISNFKINQKLHFAIVWDTNQPISCGLTSV